MHKWIEHTLAALRLLSEDDSSRVQAVRMIRDPAMIPSATTVEPAVAVAVRQFAQRLAGLYPVKRIMLFGSRARGTNRTDSDADVAVLLRGARGPFLDTKLEMVDIAYDVLLDTGIHIQPLPIWENEWEQPEIHRNPRLLQNIEREGIAF
jgi:predicted nucleotidyltransferase